MTDPFLLNTGDSFKSSHLEGMIIHGRMTNSYKILWLRGVFEEVCAGRTDISFSQIVGRMCAAAWYPVIYFRLSFGVQDQLPKLVAAVQEATGLPGDASEQDVIAAVASTKDPAIQKAAQNLCCYVPYRLIRLFYDSAFAQASAERGRKIRDFEANRIIRAANAADAAGAPYVINSAGTGLTVDSEWAHYFHENELVIRGWLDMKLVQYLQSRNPSVPAIPLKIYAPRQRDLSSATKFWKDALALRPMTEIYSGIPFTQEAFAEHGSLSIDHFIPWSFVLHDEPWNLVPMFKNSNSSKSDRLPDLDAFLEPFAEQQFAALMAVRNTRRHKTVLEAYLQIEPDFSQMEETPEAAAIFGEHIARVIRPLHQIALNQGFQMWDSTYTYTNVPLQGSRQI